MADNIAEPTQAEAAQMNEAAEETAQSLRVKREYFNVQEAGELIARHYGRAFKNLSFNPPMQIVDGCVVDFIDDDMKVTVATARMRFLNRVYFDNQTSQMRLEIMLSDLTFNRGRLGMSVGAPSM